MGCYPEVRENEKLVWSNALLPGYHPPASSSKADAATEFLFTAMIELKTQGSGTLYKATVIHADKESCKQHAAMGFYEGWGKALDQLLEYTKKK